MVEQSILNSYFFACLAGLLGALASVFAKLAVLQKRDISSFIITLTHLSSVTCSHQSQDGNCTTDDVDLKLLGVVRFEILI